MQSLIIALSIHVRRHAKQLQMTYDWSFNEARLQERLGLSVRGKYWSQKATSLKRQAAKAWRAANAKGKLEIAHYAVCGWGGIGGNYPATIEGYVESIAAGRLPNQGVQGIASWSKIATFANPGRYAVFDSRVSCALNALQAAHGLNERWWFPHLPTKNARFMLAWQRLKARRKGETWKILEAKEVYPTYLKLLRAVAKMTRASIQDVEMVIFATAEGLATDARIL